MFDIQGRVDCSGVLTCAGVTEQAFDVLVLSLQIIALIKCELQVVQSSRMSFAPSA